MDIQAEFLLNANIQQDDGLFMHCRSVPYYWGRGNGFAALGYAETLTRLPESHPARDTLIDMHTRHLDAVRGLQRPSGMLSQLLDFPGTYQELTSVCMTGYAVARGYGWMVARHGTPWRGRVVQGLRRQPVESGVGADRDRRVSRGRGTGTGAVNDRRFYIDRAAEYDQDDRTGISPCGLRWRWRGCRGLLPEVQTSGDGHDPHTGLHPHPSPLPQRRGSVD